MAIVSRFFTITTDSGGALYPSVIGNTASPTSGYVKQIIIRADVGAPSTVDVQLRYFVNNDSLEYLVYDFTDGDMPFTDCSIDAPYTLKNENVGHDLILYVATDSIARLQIRIDFDFDPET